MAGPGARRLFDQLAAVGDALWPPADEGTQEPVFRRYALVVLAIAVVLVLRRIDGITNPQFWAEDGSVFFQDNLALGCRGALATFFRGFPHLDKRLVACAATPVPFAYVPLVYNLVGYLVAAASLATFALPWFRHVVRSDALRVVFSLAVASAAQAIDLVGNLTNMGWFLGIWLMLITVARLPRGAGARAALAGVVVVASFSNQLVVVAGPVWLARALHAAYRRRRGELAFATAILAAMAALVGIAGDIGRETHQAQAFGGALLNVMSLRILCDAGLGERTIDGLAGRLGPWSVYATALALLAVPAAIVRRPKRPLLAVMLFSAYGIVATTAVVLTGHPPFTIVARDVPTMIESRTLLGPWYVFLPVVLVYLAVVASVDRLPARSRTAASAALVAWLVVTLAPTFILKPLDDLDWRQQAARLEQKLADGSPEPLRIPVNPNRSGFGFAIVVNRRIPASEVKVRPQAILGPLPAGAVVEQSFVARCARLSEVDLMFAREGTAAGQTLQVSLLRGDTRRMLVGMLRPASEISVRDTDPEKRVAHVEQAVREAGLALTDEHIRQIGMTSETMQKFYFPPIADSEGKSYVISIVPIGGTSDDAISVYTSTGDAYPDGQAHRDRRALGRDLVFGYGCSTP